MYTGEIDYFSQQPELHLLNHTLHADSTLRREKGAAVFWFDTFIDWMQTGERSRSIEMVAFNTTALSFPTRRETWIAIREAQLGPLPIITDSTQFYTFLCEFFQHAISAEVIDDVVMDTKGGSLGCSIMVS